MLALVDDGKQPQRITLRDSLTIFINYRSASHNSCSLSSSIPTPLNSSVTSRHIPSRHITSRHIPWRNKQTRLIHWISTEHCCCTLSRDLSWCILRPSSLPNQSPSSSCPTSSLPFSRRFKTLRRRANFQLAKLRSRLHIAEGLLVALRRIGEDSDDNNLSQH